MAVCVPRFLPPELVAEADRRAVEINPENEAEVDDAPGSSERLVVMRKVYWGVDGVRLTVGFLDNPPPELRAKILSHMNAWNRTANVEFVETATDPQVRISRVPGLGHWSYLGTDILTIPKHQPTMNLDGFTMNTREAEFFRVVRHETGHTLGFPHEHMREALIKRLDRDKVIAEFMRTQGWSEQTVIQQILTPLELSSIFGSEDADEESIMCYQMPARLTLDGEPIAGGRDINELDYRIAAEFYPKPAAAV